LPNVGPYIYDVSISGFTRSSIYIYDISSLRVNKYDGRPWIYLAQDRNKCRAVVNMVTNVRAP